MLYHMYHPSSIKSNMIFLGCKPYQYQDIVKQEHKVAVKTGVPDYDSCKKECHDAGSCNGEGVCCLYFQHQIST